MRLVANAVAPVVVKQVDMSVVGLHLHKDGRNHRAGVVDDRVHRLVVGWQPEETGDLHNTEVVAHDQSSPTGSPN